MYTVKFSLSFQFLYWFNVEVADVQMFSKCHLATHHLLNVQLVKCATATKILPFLKTCHFIYTKNTFSLMTETRTKKMRVYNDVLLSCSYQRKHYTNYFKCYFNKKISKHSYSFTEINKNFIDHTKLNLV